MSILPLSIFQKSTPSLINKVEIVLHIFSYMELKTLIACEGVCQEWRQLVPLADLHHDRRRLLELYHDVIGNEQSLLSANPQTSTFDRQAYIDQLLQQYPRVPDGFKLWILEWPSRAVIDGLWPSFPLEEAKYIEFNRRIGVNWIALNPPQILTLVNSPDFESQEYEVVPAILAYRYHSMITWIVFDDRPELFGRVYTLYEHMDFIDADMEDAPELATIQTDWISYISFIWRHLGPSWYSGNVDRDYRPPNRSIPQA
ncbi:hypothetical protein HYPSUDRAFT_201637 [Hypholoma sublateritium FD-334 SS-4]|uniref:F-box domain-containing protein n=1 Tax=Hypholoma sublateritium (strain FD-334 SS-4) TaxID=945553 RepID=A0A0D2MHF4_HYPSF|nr:hypothetical protein HYPSUDRAFT_201637 [Hypholoma sublateritium FD-334 SS-4]